MTINPPSVDMAGLITSAGLGTFAAQSGWSVVVGREIDEPDTLIVVMDTAGLVSNPKYSLDEAGIQVIVRGTDYRDTYNQAFRVKEALAGLPPQTIQNAKYISCICISEIPFLKWDDKQRCAFSINFLVRREPQLESSSARSHREEL